MIRIMIVDDHAIVRQGLAQILENTRKMKVVAEYANGIDALNWLRNNDCDIALIDISMPEINGIDLLKRLREITAKLPVLVISAHPEDQYAVRLLKAGANGYLVKECAPEDVVAAVNCVLGGKKYISADVAEMLTNELRAPGEKLPHETLSNREYQIFMLLASAKTTTEIAETLRLSSKTISTYRNRILEKMRMRNNAELMQYAISKKLTTQ
ncbi:MAG: response regulator transcription factor [Gallionella sp.]|nr:response regulator transcription factor [Gallionella sp.]